jgi:hypothetical protein
VKAITNLLTLDDDKKIVAKFNSIGRMNLTLLVSLNENLLIILAGLSISFVPECLVSLSKTVVGVDPPGFALQLIIAILWFILSILQTIYTVNFIILQKSAPNSKVNDVEILASKLLQHIHAHKKRELAMLGRTAIIWATSLIVLMLAIVAYFLYINGWLPFERLCPGFSVNCSSNAFQSNLLS